MSEQYCVPGPTTDKASEKRPYKRRDRGDPCSALAFTIQEFCDAHRISRTTYYELKNDGKAPQESQVRGRILIDAEAAADWRREQRVPVLARPAP